MDNRVDIVPEIVEQERCFYCNEWYPKPVSYHHSEEECCRNMGLVAESDEISS